MLRKVRFYGHLRRRFGTEYQFDVDSPYAAFNAAVEMIPGFREYMVGNPDAPLRILDGFDERDKDTVMAACSSSIIRFVPVAAAAKDDFAEFLTGAALFYIGWQIGTPFWGSALKGLGIGMAMGGISKMLAPTPPMPTSPSDPGTYFSGSENTVGQGECIGFGYGEFMVGTQVLSAGLDTAPPMRAAVGGEFGVAGASISKIDGADAYFGGNGDSVPYFWAIEPSA